MVCVLLCVRCERCLFPCPVFRHGCHRTRIRRQQCRFHHIQGCFCIIILPTAKTHIKCETDEKRMVLLFQRQRQEANEKRHTDRSTWTFAWEEPNIVQSLYTFVSGGGNSSLEMSETIIIVATENQRNYIGFLLVLRTIAKRLWTRGIVIGIPLRTFKLTYRKDTIGAHFSFSIAHTSQNPHSAML